MEERISDLHWLPFCVERKYQRAFATNEGGWIFGLTLIVWYGGQIHEFQELAASLLISDTIRSYEL